MGRPRLGYGERWALEVTIPRSGPRMVYLYTDVMLEVELENWELRKYPVRYWREHRTDGGWERADTDVY